MSMQPKSRTMQMIQAKQEQQAKDLVARIGKEFSRVKQSTEELTGERGENRAVRQADFAGLTRAKLTAKTILSGAGVQERDFNMLKQDVDNLYRLLAKIAGE